MCGLQSSARLTRPRHVVSPTRTSTAAALLTVRSLDYLVVRARRGTLVSHGQMGLSEALRRFVNEYPYERIAIVDFMIRTAAATPAGAAVLDLGAGDAPYRELFGHTRYVTQDWGESPHYAARSADIIGSADALPVADATFDLVVCTQVLEHVPNPQAVLGECFRLLRPGGRIALSVPLIWELHELPHDYFRYTDPGLRHLLTRAGFEELEIEPRSDGFTTIAQMLLNMRWAMGDQGEELAAERGRAREVLGLLAEQIARLAPLDQNRIMPLGYSATARKL